MILAFSANAFAQRKAVSAAEVTGTFKLTSDASRSSEFKIEFFTALKLGPNGEARGNTANGFGTAQINGDRAFFTPEGQGAEECLIIIKFVKLGQIKVTQEGTCGFINEMISTNGTYKRTSATKPKFTE